MSEFLCKRQKLLNSSENYFESSSQSKANCAISISPVSEEIQNPIKEIPPNSDNTYFKLSFLEYPWNFSNETTPKYNGSYLENESFFKESFLEDPWIELTFTEIKSQDCRAFTTFQASTRQTPLHQSQSLYFNEQEARFRAYSIGRGMQRAYPFESFHKRGRGEKKF